MKILSIRQEGTATTGALLFVDIQTKGRFGDVEVTYQLGATGAVILPAYINGKEYSRKPSVEETALLAEAFKHFQEKGPTGAQGYAA
jgi:hypothetical protein